MITDLPPGWVRTTLGEVVDYGATKKAEPGEIEPDAWVLELEDIEKHTSTLIQRVTFSVRNSKSTKNAFDKGDVLYGKLRPYLNKIIIADNEGFCTTEIVPIKAGDHIDSRYLFYSLKRREFLDYAAEVSHGLNMPRLGTKQGRAAPFVLAPLNEQIRIANKLDSLLAKVAAAQKRLEKIPTLLKRFRQSVLAAATSGELTREWRGGELDWATARLSDICRSISDGDHQAPPRAESGVPFLVISNVSDGYLKIDEASRWVPQDYFDDLRPIRKPELNDILYTVTGSFGIPVLVDSESSFCFQRHIAIIKPDHEKVDFKYLYLILGAPEIREMAESFATGTAQKTVSLTTLRSFQIPLPGREEQREIVRRVESIFALTDVVEKQYNDTRRRTNRLTQSLLAKAFRGELVEQDQRDEPASELLKKIMWEKKSKTEVQRQSTQGKKAVTVVRNRGNSKMSRSRKDENVWQKPYLAKLVQLQGVESSPQDLFIKSELSIEDFYKQLAWEEKKEYLREEGGLIKVLK